MDIEGKKKELGMFLYDKECDNKYLIFEDENGMYIMSLNDVCIIDEFEELIDVGIDFFKIDGVLKMFEYLIEVIKMYREVMDLCVENCDEYEVKKEDWIECIESIQLVNRKIDIGFFFKEMVY